MARYQQYRAVHRALDRLTTGATRAQDGESDRRGGIVWHTQGSGKSLTMVFLVRAMRTHPDLVRFKVVVVTDRTDLQRQLSATAALTGEIRADRDERGQGQGAAVHAGQGAGLRDDPEVPQPASPQGR